MAEAHRSFATLRGEARTWSHSERAQEAWRRQAAASRAGISSQVSFALGGAAEAAPAPAESEQHARLWLARPDRLREEWLDGACPSLLVQVGATWWSHGPHGAVTNNGSPETQSGSRIDRVMLDPAELLAWRELEIAGRSEQAGREVIQVRSTPGRRDPFMTEAGGHFGYWPQELLVDAERGLLLRTVSLLDDDPFAVSEFTAIAFDERIPAELFVFEPPACVELQDARSAGIASASCRSTSSDRAARARLTGVRRHPTCVLRDRTAPERSLR